jgi:hypothetical protein
MGRLYFGACRDRGRWALLIAGGKIERALTQKFRRQPFPTRHFAFRTVARGGRVPCIVLIEAPVASLTRAPDKSRALAKGCIATTP